MLAYTALDQGQLVAARDYCEQGNRALATTTSATEQGFAALCRGYVFTASGDLDAGDDGFAAAAAHFAGQDVATLRLEAEVGRVRVALHRGAVEQAVALVDPALPQLDDDELDSAVRPADMLTTCWQALLAAADPRSSEILALARTLLIKRADRIDDSQMRAGYLALPAHVALIDSASAG